MFIQKSFKSQIKVPVEYFYRFSKTLNLFIKFLALAGLKHTLVPLLRNLNTTSNDH